MRLMQGAQQMNKHKLFKPIDIVIYFNAVVFIASGISAIYAQAGLWGFFFFVSTKLY